MDVQQIISQQKDALAQSGKALIKLKNIGDQTMTENLSRKNSRINLKSGDFENRSMDKEKTRINNMLKK